MSEHDRIRILMVVPYFPTPVRGGLERQAYLLSRALAADGHKVTVLGRRFCREQPTRDQADGVEVVRLTFGLRLLDGIYQCLIPFAIFGRRHAFDIVHIHTIKLAGLVALLSAKLMGMKTLVKIPSNVASGIPAFQGGLGAGLRKRILRMSDSVIALSAECFEQLKHIGYPAERVLRTVNGVRMPDAGCRDRRRPDDPVHVVFLGRLIPRKGLLDLLGAWTMLDDSCRGRQARLSIYGAGPMARQLQERVAAPVLADSVRLWDHADAPQEVLQQADILVLPSYGEGNSNAVLEAMASGLPIASTRLGGTMNLVGADGQAFLHDPGDVEGLAEILRTLIANRQLRAETGRRMAERATRHFMIGSVKDRYVEAYRLILEGKREMIHSTFNFPPD